ncbi:hypothetical protein KCP69_12195 [Salmonella enterica subsp. enterica]|nr:hypothetical protein KCP69_12195 [Salmonella enterica subsp. enterica]
MTVGSKIDTEGALLGNMILQVLEEATALKRSIKFSSGRRQSFVARYRRRLDIYPEYTGNERRSFKDENDRHGKMQRNRL